MSTTSVVSTRSGEVAVKSFTPIVGVTPQVRPALLKALAELRRESELIAERERAHLSQTSQAQAHSASGAAGLIAALGAPLDVAAAPPASGRATGLIAALGAPLEATGDQRERVELALQKSLAVARPKKGSTGIVKASALNHAHTVAGRLKEEIVVAMIEAYLRSPLSDFMNLGFLLVLDIYKHTEAAVKKLRELGYEVGDFIRTLPAISIMVQLRFIEKDKAISKHFPPPKLLIDYLEKVERFIQQIKSLALLTPIKGGNQPKVGAKAAQALAALRSKKIEELLADLKKAQDSVGALLTILRMPDPTDLFNGIPHSLFMRLPPSLSRYASPNNDNANVERCVVELALYVEMMSMGFQDISKHDNRFVVQDCSFLIEAAQAICKSRTWANVESLKCDLLEGFRQCSAILVKAIFNTKSDPANNGEDFLAHVKVRQRHLLMDFFHSMQTIIDVLIAEPTFPGFVSQEIHFLNLLERCDLFCDVVKRRGLSSSSSGDVDQIISLAIEDKEQFLYFMALVQRASKSNHYFESCFAFYALAFSLVLDNFKQKVLPTFDRFRQERLSAAEVMLRQKSLEELTQGRQELEKALLPLYAPDVEDLCHFILYIKRYENFMSVTAPGVTQKEHYFVPLELVNYLMLEGIDELFDRLIDEKTKAAAAAKAPAPQPSASAAASAKVDALSSQAAAAASAAAPAKVDAPAARAAAAKAPPVAAAPAPLKIARGDKFQTVLNRLKEMGYEVKRQKGSHLILARLREGRENSVVLPNHPQFAPGTARSIENQAN
jgi:predicted RNA binding protein YcfA (HicA-like mRNA interferase family)